jgi:hypothetical protein
LRSVERQRRAAIPAWPGGPGCRPPQRPRADSPAQHTPQARLRPHPHAAQARQIPQADR